MGRNGREVKFPVSLTNLSLWDTLGMISGVATEGSRGRVSPLTAKKIANWQNQLKMSELV